MAKIKKINILLVLGIIVLVIVATSLKVYNNHKSWLFRVVDQRIEEAAKKCFIDGVCGETTTLGFLVEKGYLENQVHPITKEYVNADLVITCKDFECETSVEDE